MPSLEIYKASAGSGKTFRIVREYLKMVFQRPASYKNILAVTFTNKATAEMKDRILKDLALLSSGQPSGHLEYLKGEFRQSEEQIRITAEKILKLILHDYSRFSVSTIDSFFQRVIRAFSREMRLNASYRTELDAQMVLEEAVDRLFLEIDTNPGLRNWMLEYTDQNLREGRNWNFREDLTTRAQELFKEEFKLFSEPLLQKLADKIHAEVRSFPQQQKLNSGMRVFVDSAPVLEKALAEKAGLGWIGKHSNLINRKAGSWFFLGEIYTHLPLPVDSPATAHCGACTACLDICPTQAIIAPYQVDARRCVSY